MNYFNKSLLITSITLFFAVSLLAQADQFGVTHAPQIKGEGLTVVDFAASWCKPCIKSLPKLQELSRKHLKTKFLVISVDETQKGRDKLIQRTGVIMPVVWDAEHSWAEFYSPEGMPSLFIVDQSGNVIYSHVGFNQEKWDHFVLELKKLEMK